MRVSRGVRGEKLGWGFAIWGWLEAGEMEGYVAGRPLTPTLSLSFRGVPRVPRRGSKTI